MRTSPSLSASSPRRPSLRSLGTRERRVVIGGAAFALTALVLTFAVLPYARRWSRQTEAIEAARGQRDRLQALVEGANQEAQDNGTLEPLVAVPYEDIEGDFDYVLSAWTRTQSCLEYSREAIDDFRAEFQGRGPEQAGVAPFSS